MARITDFTLHQMKAGRTLTINNVADALQLLSIIRTLDDITQELNAVMACWASDEDLMKTDSMEQIINTARRIYGDETLYNLLQEIGRSVDFLQAFAEILNGAIEKPKAKRLEALQAERVENYKQYAREITPMVQIYLEENFKTITGLYKKLEKENRQEQNREGDEVTQ